MDARQMKMERARARLIDAAPDLLKALKSLQKAVREAHLLDIKKRFDLCVADSAASRAIARAEGQQTNAL